MRRILFIVPLVFVILGCAGNKLNNSMWYNATLVNNVGIWGTVVTSMAYYQDSVYVFNSVVVDDSIIIPPYLYAKGVYQCKKKNKTIFDVSVQAATQDFQPYTYFGEMNYDDKIMRLSAPGQKTNETYFMDKDTKKPSEIINKNKKK